MNKIHPGAILRDWLRINGTTQGELAQAARITPSIISDLIRRKRRIHAHLAIRIESATGILAEELMGRQAAYDLAVAREELAEGAEPAEVAS